MQGEILALTGNMMVKGDLVKFDSLGVLETVQGLSDEK